MNQSYMTRALQSSDPRFATVLTRLGHQRRDLAADAERDRPDNEEPVPVVPKRKRTTTKDKADD